MKVLIQEIIQCSKNMCVCIFGLSQAATVIFTSVIEFLRSESEFFWVELWEYRFSALHSIQFYASLLVCVWRGIKYFYSFLHHHLCSSHICVSLNPSFFLPHAGFWLTVVLHFGGHGIYQIRSYNVGLADNLFCEFRCGGYSIGTWGNEISHKPRDW